MKRRVLTWLLAATLVGGSVTACKQKAKEENTGAQTVNTDTNTALQSRPVEVSSDDQLRKGVEDATKDYPGVNARVDSGVVILTGNIERSRLPNLMQSLHALNPRNVDNKQLIIK